MNRGHSKAEVGKWGERETHKTGKASAAGVVERWSRLLCVTIKVMLESGRS